MGCDIHLQVQGQRDGAWEFVKIRPFARWGEPGFEWDTDPTARSYLLFAFLAGVRRYGGVGYLRRGHDVAPILPVHGLPEGYVDPTGGFDNDSDEYNEAEAQFTGGDFWIGDHTFTHAALRELLDVPWSEFEVRDEQRGTVSSADLAEHSFVEWLSSPAMQQIASEYGGAENVRIVIGFDN